MVECEVDFDFMILLFIWLVLCILDFMIVGWIEVVINVEFGGGVVFMIDLGMVEVNIFVINMVFLVYVVGCIENILVELE